MNLEIELFSWGYFFLAGLLTVLPFIWVLKRPLREKVYVLPFAVFFFAYSGVGVAWESCRKDYLIFYTIWMFVFSYTVYFTMGKKKYATIEGVPSSQIGRIIKHADFFIIVYFLIELSTLAMKGKLYNLISPPSPDLLGAIEDSSGGGGGLLYYLNHIIFIFYFVSLYKYRYQVVKLFLLIFLPFYINYVGSGYLARSTIMAYLIIYVIAIYYYNPSLRKKIRLAIFVGMPVLLIGLSFYTFIRMGRDINISAGDAISLLAYQETSYPTHFDLIQAHPEGWGLLGDYFQWLTTLPLPGFLKDSSKDYLFNVIFTEKLFGTYRGQMGFSVALPGIVNEGIFIFGNYLYPIHAIILGLFVGFTYRLVNYKEEFFLFLYVSIFLSSLLARAGTVSAYSVYLKDLLVYEIIIFFMLRGSKPKHRNNGYKSDKKYINTEVQNI